ncbi:hypothetical protein VOI54_17400 [Tamlana sp. 2201CG12-4]|uniref:hypothetical protein n=1 Tax=Tamlana sp. 2201CG12-4 TaxID=3112582 RepID=UPI002DB66FF9|nr:hypothetical protein [Tamlana sp. 2201CG12-4]MEC3908807.1 hypothetical protein [Tamlana sp. 2201CG12-4]
MKHTLRLLLVIAFISISQYSVYAQNKKETVLWEIDSQKAWEKNNESTTKFNFEKGMVSGKGTFVSKKKKFKKATKLTSITFEQSPIWNNWKEVAHVGPSNLRDAPVLLSLKDKDYWIFGRYGALKEKDPFQTNGKGGETETLRGYHAWHSTDMVHWVHHGPITDWEARWVTTAEYVDGKFYFYADIPNDTDPHLIIDDDIYDGKMGKQMGMVYDDGPGSDMAIIRDLDGTFHLISENWSPINARLRAWDSPLADHAVSPDGIRPFKNLETPAVDHRTKPTGKYGFYKHLHWGKENTNKYEIHTPIQNAYGDWTIIRIGDQYHLFGDYDEANEATAGKKTDRNHMKVGRFTSSSLDKTFEFSGTFGKGHPDPTVGYAEGKFYLISQTNDFVSNGPWINGVSVRVGVDSNSDKKIDTWTNWKNIKETYNHTPGFPRVVSKTPASLDLASLPKTQYVQFEFKIEKDQDGTDTYPILDKIILE